ncbi:hypothetical protein CPB86DRAFT_787299 [Serendipita vermifera]|nr:hypothetical protein CPB86DRAFT_787299 [Serendipita vermifera]
MPKATASSHSKPLTQRPLDLLYYVFFAVHFVCSITIDCLPLWPEQLYSLPGLKQIHAGLHWVVKDYTQKSNDPFMLATHKLVQREWEFAFLNWFMIMEIFFWLPAFVIGMIGLQRDSKAVYPFLLAYSTAALITTSTVAWITLKAPSASDPSLDPVSKFYALTDEGRNTILGPLIPFLIIPIIMFVDMMSRVTNLVNAGIKAQAAQKSTNGKKHI